MLFNIIIILFLQQKIIMIVDGNTDYNGIKIFRSIITQKSKENFEYSILREFNDAGTNISPKSEKNEEEKVVKTIKDEDLIILRDIKLTEHPELKITFLNSDLDFFSTRIDIEAPEDFIFIAKIYYVSDEKNAVFAGNLSYTVKNIKGFGFVGLDVNKDDNFFSTNYFMNYKIDETRLESNCIKLNHQEKFIENQLKPEIRKLITSILKKRFDTALAKISAPKIFDPNKSNVLETKKKSDAFYENLLDELLIELNKQVDSKNKTEIQLPDIDFPFAYNIGFVNLYGQFLASDGSLRNLATFVRRGPISLSFDSGNFIIFGSLGLSELAFGYGVSSMKIGGIGPSGKIDGKIGENSAQFAISINLEDLSMNLKSFEITELSNIELKLTGFGPFNWLASKIASILLNGIVKSDIVPLIEPMIKEEIDEILSNIDLRTIE